MPEKPLNQPFLLLSCKIDSLYHALQYYIDDLPEIKWFTDQIPVASEDYCKINPVGGYLLANPYKVSCGGLHGQLARISWKGELLVATMYGYRNPVYDSEGMLDAPAVKARYSKVISFGVDNILLLDTFARWFSDNGIRIKRFKTTTPTVEMMAAIFIRELQQQRVIICNGVVTGFRNPRTFSFGIIDSDKTYKWKEASHSFVIIGYDKPGQTFFIADNYGTMQNPYSPQFYNLTFNKIHKMITLLDPYTFDNTFSIGY